MRIGILQAGRVNEAIVDQFGEYPNMFESLLAPVDPSFEFERWRLLEEQLPSSPRDADAWLITGSRHGVYDDLPWLPAVTELIQQSYSDDVPVVGVCFGHQLLAQALGGKVIKSERGWGIGVQSYDIVSRPPWMGDALDSVSFQSIHQDQIVELPAAATVVAASEFCPYAILAYGDWAFSIQPHPEFSEEFARALLTALRGDRIPAPLVDDALATLHQPTHSASFAQWTRDFLSRRFAHSPVAAAS